MNNAATIPHMSGGQFRVPLVIRMATGAGRQLAAQHSHSLEGWFAHIPGIKVVAPATVEDARFMLAAALADPNPVLIFEHIMLYNMEDELDPAVTAVDIEHAKVRRERIRRLLVTFGGCLWKTSMPRSNSLPRASTATLSISLLRPSIWRPRIGAKTHRLP